MRFNTFGFNRTMKGLLLAGASFGVLQVSAYAQEVEPEEEELVTVNDEAEDGEDLTQDKIVVTGSRLQRSEFTSTSPVQVLKADVERNAGLVSATDILQSSTANSGLKIDATFNQFVLDNGPGAAEVNLRGLGANRTLLLVNSRRLSPSGVEGAPSSPDLNLIPSILLDRIEILLDGSSSIYGADAVAGVANAILRKDIEGFEFDAEYSSPLDGGGVEQTFSGAWGISNDNGFMGFGAEYADRSRVRFSDRDFTDFCEQNRSINPDGGVSVTNNPDPGEGLVPGTGACELSLINRVFIPVGFGSVYFTPGSSNIGIPNFTESQVTLADGNGDGITDVDIFNPFFNANASGRENQADLLSPLERWSIYGYGEYNLGFGSNTSVFYEALYSNRITTQTTGGAQLFPTVPADNPFNPCNQNADGVNCLDFFGVNFGNLDTVPIISIRGDRDKVTAEVAQTRFVAGLKGDLPGFESFNLDNWTYEVSAQYSRSNGTSKREGILNDRLELSLNTTVEDPATGELTCGIDLDGDGIPDNGQIGAFGDEDLLSVPCVPVNLLAPSIYQEGGGDFATQAERDYLFGTRNFNTVIDQTVIQGIIQGDLFELPWNGSKVPLVFGLEYRDESIFSDPDDVAEDGLLFGFFADKGATGRRDFTEAFVETEITPIRGRPGVEELTANLSARWTEEENFGALWTWSAKGKWRPVDWLAINGTAGTSYRAPGLREQFLRGSTGFNTVGDPCVVPLNARADQGPGVDPLYDPTEDQRSQQTLNNCVAAGVDPTSLGLAGNLSPNQSVEISTGGSQGLLAEESDSFTYGFTLEQPWTDAFNLSVNLTYYDTEITDSVAEPGPGFIVRDCFVDNPNLGSGFCNRISRDAGGFIGIIDASFINIGRETARGFDLNLLYEQEFIFRERPLDVVLDLRVNKTEERELDLSNTLAPDATDEQIAASIDDNVGEPEFPEWRANANLRAGYKDWSALWRTSYIEGGQDDRDDTFDPTATDNPVDFTDDYVTHNVSLTYSPDRWGITVGVENVFDEQPTLVDGNGTFSVRNVPIGVGQDVLGRRVFILLSREF